VTTAVGTAVAVHELALARVLAAGLERVHPDWRLTVLLLDGDPASPSGEPFDTVGLADLSAPGLGLLQAVTDGPRALATALRPALLAHLVERDSGPAVWLDATVRVLGPLDALVTEAAGGVALVPLHSALEPSPGLAVRAPFESGAVAADDVAALGWWAETVAARARELGSRFRPALSDCLGALAGAAGDVRIVRDPGLCAGWWTLGAGRRIGGDPPRLDGAPLSALNVAGFDPRAPHWLSAEDRDGSVRVSRSPELARLLAHHARELLGAGWRPPPDRWRYATLPTGLALDDDLRDLFALAQSRGLDVESPFSDAGCDAFLRWVDSESPIGAGVTWYLERVHRRRPDLQAAFPDLGGGDGARLSRWMEDRGAVEEPVLAELSSRRPVEPSTSRGAVSGDTTASVRVVGYLGDGLGLGQAARSYASALRVAGVETETVSIPAPMASRGGGAGFWNRRAVEWDGSDDGRPRSPVEIVCMNPPELLRANRAGVVPTERDHRVGVWAWELDSLPGDWARAFPLVDEVWAYSEYVASGLRASSPVPVEVMPLAIDIPDPPDPRPAGSPFTFLYVFDLMSSVERKNPLGLIDAFRRAFEPGEGPRLLLKTSNGDNEPQQLERVKVAALDRQDIEVLDDFLSAADRDALIAGCDCYVSLHRAEGFGLTIAEAMAAARPTIATAFSGNLDFMTEDCAHLVRWTPAEVEEGSAIYPAGARWAEPDVEHAAELMRQVHADRDAARAMGRRGRDHVAALLSPDAVGATLRRRVEEVRGTSMTRVRAKLARRMQRSGSP
jgi:glycosyltransferase involved in cell wall biosynthesis